MALAGLKMGDDGIRHPKLGSDVLRWDEILYVDYREIINDGGPTARVLVFTLTPPAMTRLNKVLPIYRRFLLPSILGNSLMIDISAEPLLDEASEFTNGVQIFKAIEKHVPKRERISESGIEGFAQQAIVAHSLSTAINTPRPPRGWKDGMKLFLTAILVFVAFLALIILPAYFLSP